MVINPHYNMKQILNELDPKPKTVLELFENHPERWCQHVSYRAGDKFSGRGLASSCCVGAAIGLVYGPPVSRLVNEGCERIMNDVERDAIDTALAKINAVTGFQSIPEWNDQECLTFDQMIECIRQANI